MDKWDPCAGLVDWCGAEAKRELFVRRFPSDLVEELVEEPLPTLGQNFIYMIENWETVPNDEVWGEEVRYLLPNGEPAPDDLLDQIVRLVTERVQRVDLDFPWFKEIVLHTVTGYGYSPERHPIRCLVLDDLMTTTSGDSNIERADREGLWKEKPPTDDLMDAFIAVRVLGWPLKRYVEKHGPWKDDRWPRERLQRIGDDMRLPLRERDSNERLKRRRDL